MLPANIGFLGALLALGLLWLRLPVALVVGGVSVTGSLLLFALGVPGATEGATLIQSVLAMTSGLVDLIHSGDLLMLPLFIALGNIAFYAGVTTRIHDAAAVWLRRLPGGLAMAAVMGCGGFSAISGSSVACASTMGRICVPEMLRQGYDPKLATSSVAVGGTLGSLIPPSILFILYGFFTETPIAQLFMAGILPGLLSLAGMLLVIVWWVSSEPDCAPPCEGPAVSRTEAALAAWPALLLFVVILGGLHSAILTATQAALTCVVLTLIIGFVQQRLTLDVLWHGIRESLIQTGAILLIVVAAKLFLGFVELSGAAEAIVTWAQRNGMTYFTMLCLVVMVFLVLGMFVDSIGILVLSLPFLVPLVHGFGMDPIWFGVIVVKLLEIGLITPPVGLNVFVIGNVTREVPIEGIFAGVARFLMVDVLVLLVLLLFPVIATFIPASM
ncbi:TRAP transporter large permease [Paracoccus seriniphilus]|uniref:TRAP transporter large permease protein n=1 Tax=Paracoccus seriniphilus TaxID=184748 RepID=A0A239PTM2_9RHOB|nr:TRAP transporter large permease [Paracoccus seriniphilus]WCR14254.1 TRAP transporter large permease [Paracoccus seriniphilus]SNT73047.1 TRAP transporter, DctM subunit [Paracoccus seriniphilus]